MSIDRRELLKAGFALPAAAVLLDAAHAKVAVDPRPGAWRRFQIVTRLDIADVGDTRAELVYLVESVVRVLSTTLMGRVMQGLVSDLAEDPDRQSAFRERVVGARVVELRGIVARGVERGDVRPDADVDLMYELLLGPVYLRLLLSGAPLEAGLAERLVDAVLPGFAAAPSKN